MGAAGLVLVVRRSRPVLAFVGSLGLMSAVCLLYGTYQAGTSLLIGLVACYSALSYGVSLTVFVPVLIGFALAEKLRTLAGADRQCSCSWSSAWAWRVPAGCSRGVSASSAAANIALRELVELQSEATTRAAIKENDRVWPGSCTTSSRTAWGSSSCRQVQRSTRGRPTPCAPGSRCTPRGRPRWRRWTNCAACSGSCQMAGG